MYTENIAPRGVDVKEIQAAKARETQNADPKILRKY